MKTILIQQKYKDTLAMFIEWTLIQYITLHSVEIGTSRNHAAKPFLCVNRSPIQYDFWGGTKPIRYIVNKAFVFF